jgi:hypothetical protein
MRFAPTTPPARKTYLPPEITTKRPYSKPVVSVAKDPTPQGGKRQFTTESTIFTPEGPS